MVDQGLRVSRTNLIVKFILCLILPAYHTVQAELGIMTIYLYNGNGGDYDSLKVPAMVCPPSATGWFSR